MKMVTKLSEHLNNLLDFKVAKDVKTALEGSGFENMLCLADQPKLNGCLSLTTYLASIYDAKHMCFKISSDINLYLSLEDVLYIWGLPIVGLPIIMVEEKTQEIVERLFPNMGGKEVLKIQNLKKIAIEESNELDHRVRATVLYLIGSVCAPNKDKYASGVFGAFLEDIEMIKHYSWGELLLVGVHEALTEFSGKDINGSMFTLLIFMILHVKPVRRIFDIPEDFTPTIWPVIKEVAPLAHSVLASSSKIPTLKEIRRVMKDCTIDDIIWQPYSNVDITAPYHRYPGLSPGLLTDLMSASVNNDCYGLSAIRAGLHKHILHLSPDLHRHLSETIDKSKELQAVETFGWESETTLPKVLGDVIESLAGAILVDSGYDKETVFRSMKPLLEPLVTLETLRIHPKRELNQLCQKEKYTLKKTAISRENGRVYAMVEVEAGGAVHKETWCAADRKLAERLACKAMLKTLKETVALGT